MDFSKEQIENEVNKIKNLVQNKNLGEQELEERAVKGLIKKQCDISSRFELADDKKEAKRLFEQYVSQFPNLSPIQIELLQDLIAHIINKNYVMKRIEEGKKEGKEIQSRFTKQIKDYEDAILELHSKLGFDKVVEKSELSALETLQKKFEDYINNHKDEFTTKCANCGTMLLLRRRTKDFENLKHPFFVGPWLSNLPLLKYVKEGILTPQQGANILHGSAQGLESKDRDYCLDYINYCLEHYAEFFGDYEGSDT